MNSKKICQLPFLPLHLFFLTYFETMLEYDDSLWLSFSSFLKSFHCPYSLPSPAEIMSLYSPKPVQVGQCWYFQQDTESPRCLTAHFASVFDLPNRKKKKGIIFISPICISFRNGVGSKNEGNSNRWFIILILIHPLFHIQSISRLTFLL